MSLYLKHLESIRLPHKVTTNFACEISDTGQMSIITQNGVLIFQMCACKDNNLPSMSLKKYCIQASNFALSSHVGIDVNEFMEELSKPEIFEAVLRTELSSQLNSGSSVEQKIIRTAWSPSQMVDDFDCAIATLSNTGSIEIFIKTFDSAYYEEFVSVCNITQKYVEQNTALWKDFSKCAPSKQFNELKCRIEKVRPTVVGHYSGTLSFWKINALKSDDSSLSNVSLLKEYTCHMKHMTSIFWKEAGDKALIFIGNIEGRVIVVPVKDITEDNISIDGELVLWSEIDLIRIEHISLLTYQEHIFVIVIKGSDLIIYLISSAGKNLDTCVFHVGNVVTTGVQQIDTNKILVVSLSGAIKELKLSCVDCKINIEWRHIYININWYINQCQGMLASRNRILFGFLTAPCKTTDTKDDKVLNDFVIFSNTERDALEILLNNPSQNFRDYWDCLEVFRISCISEKQFPSKKLTSDANYDNFSFYQLKLYLWASKVCETVCEQTGNIKDYMKSYDEFLLMANIKLSILRMQFLLDLHTTGKPLSTFQLQNLNILNNYLKQIVLNDVIPKLELGDKTVTDVLEVMTAANEIQYPRPPICWICGEDILDGSCFPPHFIMQCAISFMQISGYPCYKCLFCKCLVHEDIAKEVSVVLCPFCEVSMCKTRVNIVGDKENERNAAGKKISEFCKDDCVTETMKLNSIGEHAFVNE